MAEIGLLVALVYSIVEAIEKMGLKRNTAHLLALPLGLIISFLLGDCLSVKECLIKGLLIGFSAIGSCDTICNIKDKVVSKKN